MRSTDEAGACTSRSRGASSLAVRRRVFLVLALAGAACADGGDPAGLVGVTDSGGAAAADSAGSGTGGSTSVCANGTAVADPANNAALVADCEMLLSVKDSLRGTGALNWDAGTAIGEVGRGEGLGVATDEG